MYLIRILNLIERGFEGRHSKCFAIQPDYIPVLQYAFIQDLDHTIWAYF